MEFSCSEEIPLAISNIRHVEDLFPFIYVIKQVWLMNLPYSIAIKPTTAVLPYISTSFSLVSLLIIKSSLSNTVLKHFLPFDFWFFRYSLTNIFRGLGLILKNENYLRKFLNDKINNFSASMAIKYSKQNALCISQNVVENEITFKSQLIMN